MTSSWLAPGSTGCVARQRFAHRQRSNPTGVDETRCGLARANGAVCTASLRGVTLGSVAVFAHGVARARRDAVDGHALPALQGKAGRARSKGDCLLGNACAAGHLTGIRLIHGDAVGACERNAETKAK